MPEHTPSLHTKLPKVGTTIFTVMSALAAEKGAVNLGQGFPDFDCDPRLIQAVTDAMQRGHNQYPPMPGVPALREAVAAIRDSVDINVAASIGILTAEQAAEMADMGIHRYNHNLEAGRSFFPQVVTTHSWEERWDTCQLIKDSGMELCCGGLVGMGESIEQRAELADQLGELEPHEVPLNFLNPRPGTPFGDLPVMPANDALRCIAAFRLALPATINQFVIAFMETSLIVVVGFMELLAAGNTAFKTGEWKFAYAEVYVFIAAIYFAFVFGLSRYGAYLEARMNVGHRKD